ncbi:MAG: hypothetical protein KDC95_23980, partial [Planctomycetes bacterium]|nr:hypothetical protein [Planctomycetota bacterium]
MAIKRKSTPRRDQITLPLHAATAGGGAHGGGPSYVKPLMRQNFLEYASYVIVDRAIPDLRDGLK